MSVGGPFSTAPSRPVQPKIRLSAKERTAFPLFLARADPSNTGRVEGKAAVEFFRRSGLPMDTLKEVWALAVAGEGFLDRERFFVAMRLIALAQHGHTVTNESLQGVAEVDLPQFDQVSGAAVAAEVDQFAMSQADRLKYEQIFATQTQGKATLGGQEAKALFDRAGLSPSELTRVWSLADPQDTGVLTKSQFFVAMQLLIKAKNGVRIPDSLPTSLAALVGTQLKVNSAVVQPAPPRPAPELARRTDDPMPPQPRADLSPDPALLQELLRVIRNLEGRIDSLATDFKATKSEIASLRDTQSLQIDSTSRDLQRYFQQTQTLIESIPRPEAKQPEEMVDNSAVWAKEITEELGELTREVRQMGVDLGERKGDREAVQAALGTVQGEISALQRELGAVRSDVRADISALGEDSGETKQGLSTLQAQMNSLSAESQAQTTVLASVQSSIQALQDDFAHIPQPDLSPVHSQFTQISQNLENTRQEGKETATLIRDLSENLRQLVEDFTTFAANVESAPIDHSEESADHSDPQEDLLAKADPRPQTAEKATEPSKPLPTPSEKPLYPGKQTGFLDEEDDLIPDHPNPREDFDFELPQTDPKEGFDFELPEKAHDFMFDEMMQGVGKSPAHSPKNFRYSAQKNSDFEFDSPQEQGKNPNFDFNFEGEKPKEEFQFEEPSPENKDFF